MPVFHPPGKKPTPAQQRHAKRLATDIKWANSGQQVQKTQTIRKMGRGKRTYEPDIGWGVEDSPLKKIENVFAPVLKRWLPQYIHRHPSQPVVVVDWGCGTGRGINGLAEKYGKRVKAYGFSQEAYETWLETPHAKLIQCMGKDILRYLKDNSVDVIYSHWGLNHFFDNVKSHNPEFGGNTNYLILLARKLQVGGKLVFNAFEREHIDRSLFIRKTGGTMQLRVYLPRKMWRQTPAPYIVTITRTA